MKNWIFLIAFIGIAATSNAQGKLDGDWTLSYIQKNNGKPEFNPFYVRNGMEIRFKDDGKSGVFEAHDMCNRAQGIYKLPEEGKLVISDLGVSEKACTMNWPPEVWKLLQSNSSILMVGDNLYIRFDNDQSLMAFERKKETQNAD